MDLLNKVEEVLQCMMLVINFFTHKAAYMVKVYDI